MVQDRLSGLDFQRILNGIDDGVFISDAKGNIIMVNKAAEKTGNKKIEELVGRNIDDLVAEGYCSEFVTKKVLLSRKKHTIIQKLKDGREFIVTGIPYFEEGRLEMVVACERDITELARLQTKLSRAEELQKKYEAELERMKREQTESAKTVCASGNMRKTMALARKLAQIDTTVLIQGESGTGKEVVADWICSNSSRAKGPYVKVNCGAIPENLLESEMFGYVPGAFTGALKEGKQGYFEAANGGTIFLDEIGEMPLSLQVKLLRVLQERELTPIGGTKTIPLNIRILAATNRKLKEMIRAGEFRQDLYYRLSVTTVNVPPLRERIEDIIELSGYFLDKYNQKYNLSKKFSPKALRLMLAYHWPGNVRELENLVESLVITTEGNSILGQEVEAYLFDEKERYTESQIQGNGGLTVVVYAYECVILQSAFDKYRDYGLMARELKTTRSTINRKLKKHHIR